jgi:hypothetical protein
MTKVKLLVSIGHAACDNCALGKYRAWDLKIFILLSILFV